MSLTRQIVYLLLKVYQSLPRQFFQPSHGRYSLHPLLSIFDGPWFSEWTRMCRATSFDRKCSRGVRCFALLWVWPTDRALRTVPHGLQVQKQGSCFIYLQEVIPAVGIPGSWLEVRIHISGVSVQGESMTKRGKWRRTEGKGNDPAGSTESRKRPDGERDSYSASAAKLNTESNNYLSPQL